MGERETSSDARGSSTEAVHEAARHLDAADPGALLDIFDERQRELVRVLEAARPAITRLGATLARTLRGGGRIIYVGAGTSGRLGMLDAAEWPPTFGVAPDRIVGLIAGGPEAISRAVEGAEDFRDDAIGALDELSLQAADLVCGITASGRTPFVLEALLEAKRRGAGRALVTSGTIPEGETELRGDPELEIIALPTGAELLAGSTRLLAANAAHQVLQRASVLCAMESGWIHRGHMVEMRPTNAKLRERAVRIVAELAGTTPDRAREALAESEWDIKVSIVQMVQGCDTATARSRLASRQRRLDRVLAEESSP